MNKKLDKKIFRMVGIIAVILMLATPIAYAIQVPPELGGNREGDLNDLEKANVEYVIKNLREYAKRWEDMHNEKISKKINETADNIQKWLEGKGGKIQVTDEDSYPHVKNDNIIIPGYVINPYFVREGTSRFYPRRDNITIEDLPISKKGKFELKLDLMDALIHEKMHILYDNFKSKLAGTFEVWAWSRTADVKLDLKFVIRDKEEKDLMQENIDECLRRAEDYLEQAFRDKYNERFAHAPEPINLGTNNVNAYFTWAEGYTLFGLKTKDGEVTEVVAGGFDKPTMIWNISEKSFDAILIAENPIAESLAAYKRGEFVLKPLGLYHELVMHVDTYNQNIEKVPGIVKMLFGKERINAYIENGKEEIIGIVMQDAKVIEFKEGEVQNPTMRMYMDKGTIRKLMTDPPFALEALDKGKIRYEGIGITKQAKVFCVNAGIKIYSWFVGLLIQRPKMIVEDPTEDYILDHPFFEDYYKVEYTDSEVIPPALDIKKATMVRKADVYVLSIETRGDIEDMFRKYTTNVQFGIFIDTDRNGVSDFLIVSTEKLMGAVIKTPEFHLNSSAPLYARKNSLEMRISRDLVGDNFDWSAFSGFALPPGQPFLTSIPGVFIAPVVDSAYFDLSRSTLIESFILLGPVGPMVNTTAGKRCPPCKEALRDGDAGGPKDTKGNPINDWLMNLQKHDKLIVEFWGISTNSTKCSFDDFFAKRVFIDENGNGKQDKGERGGWIAKCPFERGWNEQSKIDRDGDGVPDQIEHTVTDLGKDDDKDGYIDVMIYKYRVNQNWIEITNKERDDKGRTKKERMVSFEPFKDPSDVPGKIPPS